MRWDSPLADDSWRGSVPKDFLDIAAPEAPDGYEAFWRGRYRRVVALDPDPSVRDTGTERNGFRVFDLFYRSTEGVRIGGWVLTPVSGIVRQGFVILRGYGGRSEPDFDLPFWDAIIVFPCARGLGTRSLQPGVPSDVHKHVLHGIESRDHYVHGGCVEDVWLAVSVLLRLRPHVSGRIGFLGISFGGGIGAMSMAWDDRIARGHFNVPSFGNHALRLNLPMDGSGASIRHVLSSTPSALETLAWHDSATAASYIKQPVHCACALFDPTVPPAGQFAVYNALRGPKQLFVLTAGHRPYRQEQEESLRMLREIYDFFDSV